jgi:hypothetical protein
MWSSEILALLCMIPLEPTLHMYVHSCQQKECSGVSEIACRLGLDNILLKATAKNGVNTQV